MVTVRIMTYNLMLSTSTPIRFNGQEHRLNKLPSAISHLDKQLGGIDVLVVQELIPKVFVKRFIANMRQLGWLCSTRPLSRTNSLKLADGGVLILSKHPIIVEDRVIFDKQCTDTDCLAEKGVVYCCIEKNGHPFHVFGTHFQAWENSRTVRVAQSRIFRTFINRLNIPRADPVLICGDLNIDRYTQPTHLQEVGDILSAHLCHLHPDSPQFSVDPENNALVGNDDSSKYTTLAYPNGCFAEYMSTQRCVCCRPELLDYLGYSTEHLVPTFYDCRVVILKTEEFRSNRTIFLKRASSDLSDHFPVVGTFTFPARGTPVLYQTFVSVPVARRYVLVKVFILFLLCVTISVILWYKYPLIKQKIL